MPDSIGAAAAEVLPDDRRDCKTERHHRKEECLHHPRTNSETGLSLRSKAADDHVNQHNINKKQQELRANAGFAVVVAARASCALSGMHARTINARS